MTGCSKLPGIFSVGCKFFGPFSPITRDAQQATSILSSPDSSAPADAAQSKRRDTPREACRRYRTRRSRVNGSPPPPVVLGASHRASPRVARRNREFEAGFPVGGASRQVFRPAAAARRVRHERADTAPRGDERAARDGVDAPRGRGRARGPPRRPRAARKSRRGDLGVASPETPCPSCRQDARGRSGSRPRAPPARPARATTRPRRARARVARRVDEGQPRRRQGQEGIQG